MNKLVKVFFRTSILFGAFFYAPISNAGQTLEVESNDTMSTAQEINRNRHYPEQFISGTNISQNVVKGSIKDANDVDWYKVYVPVGGETLHIISGDAFFQVFDGNRQKLGKRDYYDGRGAYGVCVKGPYSYMVAYIKVAGINGVKTKYSFTFGEANLDLYGDGPNNTIVYRKYYPYVGYITYLLHRVYGNMSNYNCE